MASESSSSRTSIVGDRETDCIEERKRSQGNATMVCDDLTMQVDFNVADVFVVFCLFCDGVSQVLGDLHLFI